MNKLHSITVRKWLLKRCQQKAKESYLTLPATIVFKMMIQEYEKELAELFSKFDSENKGKISKQSLLDLMNKYGISISLKELNSYVRIVQSKGPTLSVEEFKQCATNDQAKAYFRRIINKSNEKNPHSNYPTDITKVLNQLDYLNKRERIVSQIQDKELHITEKLMPLSNIVNLSQNIRVGSTQRFRINRTKSTCAHYLQIPKDKENYNSISTTASTTNSRYQARTKHIFD